MDHSSGYGDGEKWLDWRCDLDGDATELADGFAAQ